jgi:predicted MFS family arabinose efflux permease
VTVADGGETLVGVVSTRRIIVAAVVVQAAISFAEQGIPTLAVFLEDDLSLSATAVGALVAMLGLGRLVSFYAAGRAVDRRGERRVLLVGALGTGVCVGLAAGADYTTMLVVFFVAGLFLATATPAGGKLVFGSVSPRRRSFAMGLRQAAVPAGGLVAAAVLPAVAGLASWRVSLLLAGAVSICGGLAAVALAGLGPPVEEAPVQARRALAGLVTRPFVLTTIWACILVGGQYVVLTFLALDARERTGASATVAAALLVLVQAAGMTARVGWGIVADRLPALRTRALPGLVTALGLATALALAALPGESLGWFLALALLAGISLNGWQGLWTYRLTEIAGVARAGTASGVALTFVALSITLATPAFGVIADTASMRALWCVLAGVLVIGLAVVLASGGKGRT